MSIKELFDPAPIVAEVNYYAGCLRKFSRSIGFQSCSETVKKPLRFGN